MKRLFNKKGLGLLETIIAIAILGVIILPLLSIFVQSAKTDEAARAVLNANYISQNYTESLDTNIYKEALADVPSKQKINGYYLTAKIQPYGSVVNESGTPKAYSHIIIYSDGSMLAVMPDGKWKSYDSVPAQISYDRFGGSYTFSADGVSLSGAIEYSNCVVTVNAMQQVGDVDLEITTSSSYETMLYSKSHYTDNYSFLGNYEVIEDLLLQDSSLVHVTTYIYDGADSSEVVSSLESYITLRNWE